MATREAFSIGGQEIAPGKSGRVELAVGVLSDHTPVSMSVHVVHGRRAGPVLFVSAAVHGDEVIGVEIVRRLLRSRALRGMAGTLLAVPIVNAFGFHNRTRYLPDRRDLNRSFPGSPRGSMAARLAHIFLQEIVARADYGIDLHSAAIQRSNLPQIRITPGDETLAELARSFAAPVLLRSKLREGSLRDAATAKGTQVLLYEAGEGLRFDEHSARVGVAGILRVMQHLGMITGRGVPRARSASVECTDTIWQRAPMGGLLRAHAGLGSIVREGEVLGVVADPFGDSEQAVLAAGDGIVIGRTNMPVVYEGDALFHLALTPRPDRVERQINAHVEGVQTESLFDEDEII